ncbi:MAG: MarR family transcriptional regulator [Alphaproteobacteria bacterium]|nr:MarR family transcriptional regulator [Alphaproteobacteria bacterium]
MDESKASALRNLRELPRLIERMHRRFLDVVRLELGRRGIRDISPVQVMMMSNIGSGEISVHTLIERGYYLGSNASYNLKQLVDCGYVERLSSPRDKRAARLKLSPKGEATLSALAELEGHWAEPLMKSPSDFADIENANNLLRKLEHCWSDAVRYAESTDNP